MAEAGRLQQDDLAAAVGEIRRTRGADAVRDTDLAALFAREGERVAEAMLTAELLIHRLTEIWPATPAAARVIAVREPESAPAPARPAARALPTTPPAISDLLDAMLAAERPSTRLNAALNR